MKNNNINRVLLINPPTGLYMRGEDRCQVPVEDLTATSLRMPLDLAYIASSLVKEGVKVVIRDYPAEKKGLSNFIFDLKSFEPHLLLVSCTIFTLKKDLETLEIAKSLLPNITTVIKGVTASYWKEYILKNYSYVDIILSGEYELTLSKIIQGLSLELIDGISFRNNNDIFISKKEPIIENLDDLPFPARHLLNNNLYVRPDTNEPITTIQTGKGCPFSCIYCLASKVSGKKLRLRSTDNIIKEIEECLNVYKISNFFFRADTFTINKEWVLDLANKIVNNGLKINYVINSRVDTLDEDIVIALKNSGCFLVSLGIESGSEKSLKKMKKGTSLDQGEKAVYLLKKHGLRSYLFFMLGFPWEDKNDIEQTIKYSLKLDGDFAEFHIPVPFEETELREIMENQGLISKFGILESQQSISTHGVSNVGTKFLTSKEIMKLRKKAIIKYYLRLSYIIRTLSKVKSLKELFNYLKYGFKRVLLLVFKIN